MNLQIFIISCISLVSFTSLGQNQEGFVALPDDLTEIPSENFKPLLKMLDEVPIIGISEGTHGMNEPMDFRNELIKYLVTKKRIDVVAIESGVLESRLVHDYINGASGDLDTVMRYGIMPGFNELDHNRSLIEWLRKYNADASNEHKVSFYGFDIPGVPSNPWNEEVSIPLSQTLEYLKKVDLKQWKKYEGLTQPYFEFLHINPPGEEEQTHYLDLTEEQKHHLSGIIDELVTLFDFKKKKYLKNSSEEDASWGYRALTSTKWMDNFLRELGKAPDNSYSQREQAMIDNLDWIMNRHPEGKVLLFAHLAHLAKDFAQVNADGEDIKALKMFGEYLGEKFGEQYKVVGNFYGELQYGNESYPAMKDGIESMLEREDCKNYFLELDKSTSEFNKNWFFGLRNDSDKWQMNPANGIDFIFYTKVQTEIPW